MSRLRVLPSARLIALVAAMLLVGCAEEVAGPQFANDPAPTRAATEPQVAASPVPLPTTSPVATPASLGDVMSTRGAADRVYLVVGDTLWTIASSGEAIRLFAAPTGSALLAIDPSPSAQQIAVLVGGETSRSGSELLILDSTGQTVARLRDFGIAPGTPVPDQEPRFDTIDWSPQGDRALVSSLDGTIIVLPLAEDGEPSVFDVSNGAKSILRPAWSPTGESIAFIAATESGHQSVRVLNTIDGAVADVVSPPEGRLVVDFVWMPDGVSLLFTEGGEPGAPVVGIDLWRVDSDGEHRELVASAGTVAPVARITDVRPSPDGRSVAYAVLVPGPTSPRIDSVWLRDLASGLGFKVALPSVAAVEDIWWTDEGIVIWVRTEVPGQSRAAAEALLQVKPDGSIAVLWAAPISLATPVAATPVAATPAAATPAATPIAG